MMNSNERYNKEERESPAPKYDPAGETKQKIIFAVLAFVLILGIKFLGLI